MFVTITGQEVLVLETNGSEARHLKSARALKNTGVALTLIIGALGIIALAVQSTQPGSLFGDGWSTTVLILGVVVVLYVPVIMMRKRADRLIGERDEVLAGGRRSDYVTPNDPTYQLVLTSPVVDKMKTDREFGFAVMSFLSGYQINTWDWIIRTSGPEASSMASAYACKHHLLRKCRTFLEGHDMVDKDHFDRALTVLSDELKAWEDAVDDMRQAAVLTANN